MKTSEIAAKLNGELEGDPEIEIQGLAGLEVVAANQIAFFNDQESKDKLSKLPSNACVIVGEAAEVKTECTIIRVADPKLAFAMIARDLIPVSSKHGWHESVVIGEGADVRASHIGANVSIGKNSYIGESTEIHDGVRIGENVEIRNCGTLFPNVVIYDNCEIGYDFVVHSGAIIGAEGFGYVRDGEEILKFPQIGRVVIGDGVEVGANSCIDRGALGETKIGDNTKIDNLVQIAHNVSIGCRVLIAAQVGISGSVVIENDVVIGGQVGIADHVTIKSGAVIGARSAVFPGKIVRAGIWAGTPVQPLEKYKEQNALMRSLARLKKEITELKDKD